MTAKGCSDAGREQTVLCDIPGHRPHDYRDCPTINDGRGWPPDTGRVATPVECIHCGALQTHRVCRACFDALPVDEGREQTCPYYRDGHHDGGCGTCDGCGVLLPAEGREATGECQVVEMTCGYPMPCPHHGEAGRDTSRSLRPCCSHCVHDEALFTHHPMRCIECEPMPWPVSRMTTCRADKVGFCLWSECPAGESIETDPCPLPMPDQVGRKATPLDHLRDRLTESYDPLAGPTVTIPRALLRDTMTALYRSTGGHDDLLDLLARYAYKEAPDA